MSMFFRLAGSLTKTIEQALALAAIPVLTVVTYTGFAIPKRREYSCADFVPWVLDMTALRLTSTYVQQRVPLLDPG
ncbi:uncharacterized protein ATNIH1004_000815 [Aspergillus tanneri]|uniref:Uncharacterized protein n=1 Tax=Aspergillus tanneri TaxID=1220188 RepID=A0A5M9N0Y7_9EURO|nr:uncharacterized protein ATNIH1004_000815 [Aspergillus tanneri]KAA8651916.1 hypothetical protein ATNIH1004_000815 [Aspergillus tanneri]